LKLERFAINEMTFNIAEALRNGLFDRHSNHINQIKLHLFIARSYK